MAKKIKIDFSKTEERSGWNTRQIPEGLHRAKVTTVQETEAQDGTAMLVYGFTPTESRYKSRNFPYYCKLQANQYWKLRDLLVAAGETVPKKALNIDPEKIVGRTVVIEVEDDSYNGNVRSSVNAVYSTDILDDEDGTEEEYDEESEEDEYDEESDEADEAEGDDEEYEDDEDFDDEELEDEDDIDDELDDDDLDDEDLDDEEDDEEEEPEPAPKRRTPARKAPAKKAAPAKRTVRRR